MNDVTDTLTEDDVVRLDAQKRSLWLTDGSRIGFAAARKRGLDVEALLAKRGQAPAGV